MARLKDVHRLKPIEAVHRTYEDQEAHTTTAEAGKALVDNKLDITFFKSTYKWVSNFVEDAKGAPPSPPRTHANVLP
jgi:hypothetical protein